MRNPIARIRLAEILGVVRDKGEAVTGLPALDQIRVRLNQNGVIDAISLPVKGSTSVNCSLGRAASRRSTSRQPWNR